MPEVTLSQIHCGCALCDQHPWADPCGWGQCRPDGLWWCEWCLSCGCHDVDEFGALMLPNCSTERFGFPDPLPAGPVVGTCEFCGVEADRIVVDEGCWMTADGTMHYTSAPVVWLPNCTCQKDLQARIEGVEAE